MNKTTATKHKGFEAFKAKRDMERKAEAYDALLEACREALTLAEIDADEGDLALQALEALRPILRQALNAAQR